MWSILFDELRWSILFDEIRLQDIPLSLAALWLFLVVLFGLWASRARRWWAVGIGATVSLGLFLAGWWSASPMLEFLGGALLDLLYPGNNHYFSLAGNRLAVLTVLAASNVVGIVSIWAGLGRPHWFFRVLPVAAISPLLLLVDVWEPCVVFLVQSAVTFVPLLVVRRVRGWEPHGSPGASPARRVGYGKFQFGVLDMLAITLLVAAVLSVAVSSPEEIVIHHLGDSGFTIVYPSPLLPVDRGTLGILLGLVMLLAAWVTLSRGDWWFRVMGFLLAWPGLLCMLWLGLWREATGRHFRMRSAPAADGVDRRFASPLRRMLGRAGLVVLSLLVLVPFGGIYYHLAFPPPIPEVVLPEPNGYDDLLAAGQTLAKVLQDQGLYLPVSRYSASDSDVVAFRATNRNTWNAMLQEVHTALDRPSRIPFHYQAIEYGRYETMDDLASVLRIEGESAAGEGRIPDAIRCFADILRLGRATGNGGLSIDWLSESGIKSVGVKQFHNLARSLDAAQCRTAMGILAAEDDDREPFEQVWQRERVWSAHALGWTGRLYGAIRQERRWTQPICEEWAKRTRAELRIAITELAVQAYSLDHGGPPERLDQLVPDYLAAVPVDPLTDRPVVYEVNEQGFVVYSPKIERSWAAPPGSEQ